MDRVLAVRRGLTAGGMSRVMVGLKLMLMGIGVSGCRAAGMSGTRGG